MSRDRTRRWRDRKRRGLRIYPVKADEIELSDKLVAAGYLNPLVADDPDRQLLALEQLIRDLKLKA